MTITFVDGCRLFGATEDRVAGSHYVKSRFTIRPGGDVVIDGRVVARAFGDSPHRWETTDGARFTRIVVVEDEE